jgi:nicotinamide mononucleotide transporter
MEAPRLRGIVPPENGAYTPAQRMRRPMPFRALVWSLLGAGSAGLAWASIRHVLPLSLTEVLGFATGAACVLLVVDQKIWNFPVGIANNLFFLVLFWRARLYGDMALQLVYVGLGAAGWWRWARGAGDGRALRVTVTPPRERALLALAVLAVTAALALWFERIGDAAPVLDALTTVLSLAAQWLLNRKRIENWYVWIAADVLYVWLYLSRGLHLTAALYAIFIILCLAGLRRWRAEARDEEASLPAGLGAAERGVA